MMHWFPGVIMRKLGYFTLNRQPQQVIVMGKPDTRVEGQSTEVKPRSTGPRFDLTWEHSLMYIKKIPKGNRTLKDLKSLVGPVSISAQRVTSDLA